MNISIIGCGYVGAATGSCLAALGNNIIFVDIDDNKIRSITNGKFPIYEPGLDELLVYNRDNVRATTDIEMAVRLSDLSFICVGTPSNADGSVNMTYINQSASEIGHAIKQKNSFHTIIIKSTVLPGTTLNEIRPIIEKHSKMVAFKDFGLGMNPEFFKESSAINDLFNPDRIILGVNDKSTEDLLRKLYSSFKCPVFSCPIITAEMIKYTSNAFLATKISFANEIGNICKKIGVDSEEVFKGVGMDSRISPDFFRAGIGFGGSCFPKDLSALIWFSERNDIEPKILSAVWSVNNSQPFKMMDLLKKYIPDLQGKTIGVLGLAFKPETDDVRESRAIPIVQKLLEEGAEVIVYDPVAMDNFKMFYPDLQYSEDAQSVLNSDAVLILTEWKIFESLDYSNNVVIDGRKIKGIKNNSREYEGVCW